MLSGEISKEELLCALCGRRIPKKRYVEKHHLETRQAKGKEIVIVCCPCGDQIHELFSNKELRDKYNSIEALRQNPRIQKWIKWIRKADKWYVCMKTKKRKR